MIEVFPYFKSDETDIDSLYPDDVCSLCGDIQPLIKSRLCSLSPSINEEQYGCLDCLRVGDFHINHYTWYGYINNRGHLDTTKKAHFKLPADFKTSAVSDLASTPMVNGMEQNWPHCCRDFMFFIGRIRVRNDKIVLVSGMIKELILTPEFLSTNEMKYVREVQERDRLVFNCIHCGKYEFHV